MAHWKTENNEIKQKKKQWRNKNGIKKKKNNNRNKTKAQIVNAVGEDVADENDDGVATKIK